MIVNTPNDNAVISFSAQDAKPKNFRFAVNAKSFRILTDSLYKNKIGSIVREISSNAYDIHKQIGKEDVPFEIHLPTPFEPHFSVKDFGTGLTTEEIENVYTVLFESTKDKDNTQLGGWGLGSKTPFSLTDNFNVISIKNGIKDFYNVFMDSNGFPTIILLEKNNTDEPNGIEVIVPTNAYKEFETEVKTQLVYFKVKPIITNKKDFVWDETEPEKNILVNTQNGILSQKSTVKYNARALFGIVPYDLEINLIKNKINNNAFNFLKDLEDFNVLLKFDINELDPTPSRESLQYNDKTLKSIEKKLLDFKNDVYVVFDNILNDNSLSFWQKIIKINGFKHLSKSFGRSNPRLIRDGITAFYYYETGYSLEKFPQQLENISIMTEYCVKETKNSYRLQSKFIEGKVTPKEDKIFIFDESDSKGNKKIKKYLIENDVNSIKVIEVTNPVMAITDELISLYSKHLGNVPIVRISTFPNPDVIKKVTATGSVANYAKNKFTCYKIKIFNPSILNNRLNDSNSEKIYDDLEEIVPALYIRADRGIINQFIDQFKILCKFTDFTHIPKVYAFNEKTLELVKDIPGWISVANYVENQRKTIANVNKICTLHEYSQKLKFEIEKIISDTYRDKIMKKMKELDKKNYVRKMLRLYLFCKKINEGKSKKIYEAFKDNYEVDVKVVQKYNKIYAKIYKAKSNFMFLIETSYHLKYNNDPVFLDHLVKYVNHFGKI